MTTALPFREAVEKVHREFPIAGYLDDHKDFGQYRLVADVLSRWAPVGGSVLDFGAGGANLAAFAAALGYQAHAADDLNDDWHLRSGNRQKLIDFAASFGVKYELLENGKPWPWRAGQFDVVMLHHVLEHLQNSPRGLLLSLLDLASPRGVLFVTVPSAVNLRKRIAVLRGRTNMPGYGMMYWSEGQWRGHAREYVGDDLAQLAKYLDLEVLMLESYHYMLSRLPRWSVPLWKAATSVVPGWRDSWCLVARKREGWNPTRELRPGDPLFDRYRKARFE